MTAPTATDTGFPATAAADGELSDELAAVVGLIAHRLSNGQTVDHVVEVGERTGWWFAELVDWVDGGRHGAPPTGPTPVLPAPASDRQREVAAIAAEAGLDAAELGDDVLDALPDNNPVTAEDQHGEEAPDPVVPPAPDATAGPYVTVLALDDLFVDHSYQRPLDAGRVRRMATAWNPRLLGLLDVSDRGPSTEPVNRYAIVNGQHRAAAAARAGVTHVACNVHEHLDVTAEARLMHELDRTTKKLTGLDQWRARRGAGDPSVVTVERIAAAHGLRVDGARGDGVLTSYGAAEKLLAQGGEQLLDSTLAVLRGAYGLAAAAWQAPLVTGIGQLLHRHPDVDVDRLTRALADTTPVQVRANATAVRDVDGGSLAQNMTRAVAGLYNRAAGAGPRIPGGRA